MPWTFDKFLSKGRQKDVGGVTPAQLEEAINTRAAQMVVVEDSATQVVLDVKGGTRYEFTEPLTGLTFSSVEKSPDESEIVFTAGTAFPSSDPIIPVNVSILGDISIEAGKSYVLNIRYADLVGIEKTVIGLEMNNL